VEQVQGKTNTQPGPFIFYHSVILHSNHSKN